MSSPALPWLRPEWPVSTRVRAGMTTRVGGVSTGPFASLNLGHGSGDAQLAVEENRRRTAAALALPGAPHWLRQVHGTRALQAPFEGTPEADAAWTCQAGVVCVVQAADCLPVLLCDESATVVAAAHAGWRGLAGGVLESTVSALPVPPARLMAWLGVAIGPQAFEVGPDVRDAFCGRDPGAAGAFARARSPGKFVADLYALARRRLAAAGVARVFGGGRCTLREPEHFFSFRRDGVTGRQAAFIWLE